MVKLLVSCVGFDINSVTKPGVLVLIVTLLTVTCAGFHTNTVKTLNPELNPICYFLALLAHHFLHVSRIRVKSLNLRLIMSYKYMERVFLMFVDHK